MVLFWDLGIGRSIRQSSSITYLFDNLHSREKLDFVRCWKLMHHQLLSTSRTIGNVGRVVRSCILTFASHNFAFLAVLCYNNVFLFLFCFVLFFFAQGPCWSICDDIICQIILAFWLILTYDLLEDRRIDDVTDILFCFLWYIEQLDCVDVRLFSNRSHFNVIYDLLLNRRTATGNSLIWYHFYHTWITLCCFLF